MEEWFIIAFFMIVVGIPVIVGTWGNAHRARLKLRAKELEVLGGQTAEKAAQYAQHTERLEERVRVLERIATDKGVALSDEIETLRNERIGLN